MNELVYSRSDGTYVICLNGMPYHVLEDDPIMKEIEAYILKCPEALAPEPLPPEPTPEERAAQRCAAIIAELNALDAQAVRYIRATMEGTIDNEGTKRYEANKKRVKELKAELQTLN